MGNVGHNGAGKSTFLRCLSGLEKRAQDRLTLSGKVVSGSRMIGLTAMVMQDMNHQPFSDTAGNELLFELKRRKFPAPERKKEADRWLKEIQLEAFADQRPGLCSHEKGIRPD